MQNIDYKRLARQEAMANAQRAALLESMQVAYNRACSENDEDTAAEYARKIRDKLLAECDWTQVTDSPLPAPYKEAWAAYRQALRDIPEQPRFPYEVDYPEKPD